MGPALGGGGSGLGCGTGIRAGAVAALLEPRVREARVARCALPREAEASGRRDTMNYLVSVADTARGLLRAVGRGPRARMGFANRLLSGCPARTREGKG